ncbi:hypothetical protein Zmor_020476 [Zophobas morio]|uniref:Uncharacterized protein n=1 Tax=Zophobas morio TaxID=2755281 RepID=A0AA38I3M5_9CUCU|nr:hypothetical protein Zmor_020476 [Zophobas morio]
MQDKVFFIHSYLQKLKIPPKRFRQPRGWLPKGCIVDEASPATNTPAHSYNTSCANLSTGCLLAYCNISFYTNFIISSL